VPRERVGRRRKKIAGRGENYSVRNFIVHILVGTIKHKQTQWAGHIACKWK
jgi:hypothetical protein